MLHISILPFLVSYLDHTIFIAKLLQSVDIDCAYVQLQAGGFLLLFLFSFVFQFLAEINIHGSAIP